MCGGYTFIPGDNFNERFNISGSQYDTLPRSYNVRPGAVMPVIIREDGKNFVMPMKWGLVPPWAEDESIGYRMINARSETVAEKPSYKTPFKRQRCLVPASGFYEWKATDQGKIPHYFRKGVAEMISFAGLYELKHEADQLKMITYTILTQDANDSVRRIHDRMPVVLTQEQEDDWLATENPDIELKVILDSEPVQLKSFPVSKQVNYAQNDFASLIQPFEG